MKVSELGEFGLIEMLARIIESEGAGHHPDLLIGIGDDTAAWEGGNSIQLSTTDMLVQDVHFTLDRITGRDLGWKSLAVNISDIAAMGGIPTSAMISLGLPSDTETEKITELYQGMAQIARRFDMAIIGGNITQAPQLIISPSVIGKVAKNRMLTRSGAKPGDLIAVTGHLGASAAGLRMLKENLSLDSQVSSTLSEAHFRPVPRVAEGQALARGGVKAAIDISDGLIADLGHICEASKVEATIRLRDIPVHPAAKAAFGEKALELALSGGEDYELLFTAPSEVIRGLRAEQAVPLHFSVIGEIKQGKPGKVNLINENGKQVRYKKGGWDHFNP
ncbi:MAG: thiamine-phosphate kinase [Dehalococcoidia bacterium]|nr:thiamine-phosphate kinase [Dehalococcoidia bacterium]